MALLQINWTGWIKKCVTSSWRGFQDTGCHLKLCQLNSETRGSESHKWLCSLSVLGNKLLLTSTLQHKISKGMISLELFAYLFYMRDLDYILIYMWRFLYVAVICLSKRTIVHYLNFMYFSAHGIMIYILMYMVLV